MMKNFKKFLSAKTVFLLSVMMVGIIIGSACSKDDKSDEPEQPASSTELVGTWYFTYNGETDYDDYFIFNSNGSGTYHYDDEQSDNFTYTYDSNSKILNLNYVNWGPERISIVWLGTNAVEIDGYGKYVRK